ncbi:MAG: transporter substrate-binding domain-containing protein [Treponema sp.]|nr:transporter substrate-binding domain-containing protein [Treponema sp.]
MKKLLSSLVIYLFLSFLFAETLQSSNLNSIRTFFGPHTEISSMLSKKTGLPLDKIGVTFYTDKFNFSILDSNLLYEKRGDLEAKEYIYSIPYMVDDCVLVSRNDDSSGALLDYESKRFVTYKDNILGENLINDFGIKNYDCSCNSAAEVLYKIKDNQADYTIIPMTLAYLLVDELGYNNYFTISHPVFGIDYRFVMSKDDYLEMEKLNTILMEMFTSGELDSVYLKYGVRSRNEPYYKSNTGFAVLISVLFIILFIAVFVMLKIRDKNHWEEL